MEQSLTIDEFSSLLVARFGDALCGAPGVAVGLSGGPDSMALARLLSLIFEHNPGSPPFHALSVDHGLRPESAAEAAQVGAWIKDWPGIHHAVLRWDAPSASRVQEDARHARYDLMAGYCRAQGIRHLFLAHHMDDQAETVLFRLAKGSGLDGLAGMRARQDYGDITFLRPLLDIPKARLLATCESLGLSFVRDPSNESENFARIRLRNSAGVLAQEGLTNKRLATTARRLDRARDALEKTADNAYKQIVIDKYTKRIVLNYKALREQPDEIGFRCLLKAIATLRPGEDYAPRMEKIEDLFYDLRSPEPFRKRTLGGLVFERDDKDGRLIIGAEEKTG